MLKKIMTTTDYNGVERTEELYFNLSKAELMEMEMGTTGGLGAMIKKVIAAQDIPSIIKIFKELILKSYGVKSDDGRRFIKNDKLREEFSQTEAYSKLFMELATNSDEAINFVNGIIPADLAKEVAKEKIDNKVEALMEPKSDNA